MLESINNQVWEIEQVVSHNGLLTTPIEKLCINLLQNTLPKEWEFLEVGEGEPSDCFRVFGKRLTQIKKWLDRINNATLLADGLDLGDLFHPEVFMNACKQRSSRQMKIPIDQLKMVCSFD